MNIHRLALALALMLIATLSGAQVTVTIDPSTRYGVWEGWGVSLAWWANVVGGFPDPARSGYIDLFFDREKGLGLNIVRYNIGGGENPKHHSLEYRAAVPGFEPTKGTWDWSADANQRWVLKAAMAKGANIVEAFSNSAPYWMTCSGSVSGANKGAEDNLDPKYYADFADYLSEVTRHYRDQWGIAFNTLEPLNEPMGDWRFGNSQEGCHVDRANHNAILHAVGQSLKQKGLATTVSASDEQSPNDALNTAKVYDAQTLGYLSRINTHTYWGARREELYDKARSLGKSLWMSEYGDGDASGLSMAREILYDLRNMHPTAWVYWQAVDSAGGWGFVKNPLKDLTTTEYTINPKYYVMMQYSRWIRPGYQFIDVDDDGSVAAYHPTLRTLVIVHTNTEAQDQQLSFDLSAFASVGKKAVVYRTSADEQTASLPEVSIADRRFTAHAKPKSVTTYVIKDVTTK